MQTIDELRAEIDETLRHLGELRLELHEREMDLAGVRPGDVVRAKDGQLYRVTQVKTFRSGDHYRAWVSGNPQRNDGTFDTSRRNLFGDWQKVSV